MKTACVPIIFAMISFMLLATVFVAAEGQQIEKTDPGDVRNLFDLTMEENDVEDDNISFFMNPASSHVTITGGELSILFPEDTDGTLFSMVITADDGNGGRDTVSLRVIIDHTKGPVSDDWDLYSSTVEVDEDGDWTIEAVGLEDIDVYFIIEDEDGERTPYKMYEDNVNRGNFSLEIDHDEFEEGEVYTYFFTNSTNGNWMEPDMSGTEVQPGDEVEEVSSIRSLILGGICISVLALLVIITLIVVAVRRSTSKENDEE